jgi:flagellar L-ring protein precursor FlgH
MPTQSTDRSLRRPTARVVPAAAVLFGAAGALAHAQDLYDRRPTPPETNDLGFVTPDATDDTMSVLDVSLTAIEPPEPRAFAEQDLVTIIISERTSIEREQSLDTSKDYSTSAEFESLPDPLELLQLRYQNYSRLPQSLSVRAGSEHQGEGSYERDDSVTARVTGRVIEVKPNGTLLVESKTTIVTDGEEQCIVLSGICRPEDVTVANTVQSNQMANLIVEFENTGDIRDSSDKGWIPKVLEAVFNF